MERKGILKVFGSLVLGSFLCVLPAKAEADTKAEEGPAVVMSKEAKLGKEYFEGSRRLKNGGPACITCHNVTNDELIPGGLLAKDLTDVYSRMGEGISGWLKAPSFPAMVSSYQNHPLEDTPQHPERSSLTAFLKHADEVKDDQTPNNGYALFYIWGSVGVVSIFILISIIWMKRKKQMVKKDIFARQNTAWDAKH